jgi:hypothetical protein
MTDLDFESSQLQLVTDALRAGPGSPEWRAALESIEHGGGDEYKSLYTARERLASGRQYREVRAGAGFTRKVFEQLDREEAGERRALPSATMIAIVSAVALIGIISAIVTLTGPRKAPPAPQLSQTYFLNTLSQSDFETELGMEWAPFGPLGLQARDGLRPVLNNLSADFHGGGVFYDKMLSGDAVFAIEATILMPRTSAHLGVEVFISDDPNFTGPAATSEHELAFLARGAEASVILPGGRVEGAPIKLTGSRTPMNVRLTISGSDASVEMNSKKLWSGRHNLDPTKHRLAGVRFLARSGAGDIAASPVVQSVRVLTPQK